MSELVARGFLRALFHAGQCLLRHPPTHDAVEDAITALQRAAEVLTSGQPEVCLTVGKEAFFLGPRLLPHASIEFHGMRRDLQQRGIDSITVLRGASRRDLTDLAAVAAGHGADLPVGGTVRLNERPVAFAQLETRPLSGLRRTYAASLDALRAVSSGRRLELEKVAGAVDGFLQGGAADAGPSLMLATLHNHDEAMFYHSVNVCLLSLALGRAAGLGDDELRRLGMGALLIDIGRVVLDDPALRLPGRLSNEDWGLVRLHPQEGALAILAATGPGQEIAAQIVLEHHVRFDGGGYPDLEGRRPHFFSRLVAVADTYDAVTGHRPHRPARTPQQATAILLRGAGEAYDPDIVEAFNRMMGLYPPGSLLRLEGGEVVMVTAAAGGDRRAMVVRDREGALLEVPEPVDLAGSRVAEVLLPDEVGVPPASLLEVAEAAAGSSPGRS
ncbi:MAG: HD domain-containing protein [Acidimicrobiia bacterium]|nr:HD domain-containing protein [Acidimicrobiia bacterium]